MYAKTNNKYSFKYLVTGYTGKGIEKVFLPIKPPDHEVHDLGGRWKRTQLPDNYPHWLSHLKKTGTHTPEHRKYVETQWKYRTHGYWFWNTVNGKKEATYLTGVHWFQLQWWKCRIRKNDGFLDYRDPVREIFYWWDYICEDPYSFGGLLGGPRRMSKSTIMGVTGTEFVTRTAFSLCGITGEKRTKAGIFYDEHILYPFKNLVDFFKPVYDTDTKLRNGIRFSSSVSKGSKQRDELSNSDALESNIEFGPTKDVNHFNGRRMERALIEEYGKIDECNPASLWTALKSCFEEQDVIIGKLLSATTADDESDDTKTGISPEFVELMIQSDYDVRLADGRTKSGLYSALMPSQHVYAYDEFGIPDSKANYAKLMARRPSIEEDPLLYSGEARRNPTNWDEYFYTNADKCQFNVMVLQKRNAELVLMPRITEKYSLNWSDSSRTKIIATPNENGFHHFSWLPEAGMLNRTRDTGRNDYERFEPLNTESLCIGHDPVMFGKIKSKRQSAPVAYGLRKYDEEIDGEYSLERMEMNASIRFQYETGLPFYMYKQRTYDPQIYFEEIVKALHFLGCEINIEMQHGAAIREYIKTRGYAKFLFQKSKKSVSLLENPFDEETTDGTHASQTTTHHYTSLLATWVNNFGHCNPFKDLNKDLLTFDPSNTLKFDHAAAFGYTLIAAAQPRSPKPIPVDITELFPVYNSKGNTATLTRR